MLAPRRGGYDSIHLSSWASEAAALTSGIVRVHARASRRASSSASMSAEQRDAHAATPPTVAARFRHALLPPVGREHPYRAGHLLLRHARRPHPRNRTPSRADGEAFMHR